MDPEPLNIFNRKKPAVISSDTAKAWIATDIKTKNGKYRNHGYTLAIINGSKKEALTLYDHSTNKEICVIVPAGRVNLTSNYDRWFIIPVGPEDGEQTSSEEVPVVQSNKINKSLKITDDDSGNKVSHKKKQLLGRHPPGSGGECDCGCGGGCDDDCGGGNSRCDCRDGRDGRDGRNGTNGQDGTNGRDGAPGTPGQTGQQGIPGRDGVGTPGQQGPPGVGIQGLQGVPGRDGVSIQGPQGPPGLGIPGRDGRDGIPGRDGRDGRDGLPGVCCCDDDTPAPIIRTVAYSVPGNYELTITGGVSVTLTMTVVGGGGGGASANTGGTGAGAGGSGYKETVVVVLPTPVTLNITVGAGGTGPSLTNTDGGAGRPSFVSVVGPPGMTLVYENGGSGGQTEGQGGAGGFFGGGGANLKPGGIGMFENGNPGTNVGSGTGGGYSPGTGSASLVGTIYLTLGAGGASSPYIGKGGNGARITAGGLAAEPGTFGGGGGGGSFSEDPNVFLITGPGGKGGDGYVVIQYVVNSPIP